MSLYFIKEVFFKMWCNVWGVFFQLKTVSEVEWYSIDVRFKESLCLSASFEVHTKSVRRLEKILKLLEKKVSTKKCFQRGLGAN